MGARVTVVLACTVCSSRNYRTTRVRKPGGQPLEMKKYCSKCNQHTVHKESK